MKTVDVPDEILGLLQGSRPSGRSEADQVKVALGIHLFLEGLVSIGKAAELAEEPRVDFEWLLVELGIPTAHYDLGEYERDQQGLAEAERRSRIR
jgi:predicted HTH domain antitoxin